MFCFSRRSVVESPALRCFRSEKLVFIKTARNERSEILMRFSHDVNPELFGFILDETAPWLKISQDEERNSAYFREIQVGEIIFHLVMTSALNKLLQLIDICLRWLKLLEAEGASAWFHFSSLPSPIGRRCSPSLQTNRAKAPQKINISKMIRLPFGAFTLPEAYIAPESRPSHKETSLPTIYL